MNKTWLEKTGFNETGEARRPKVGEWYIDKNNERVCYVYDESAIPCICINCQCGVRQIVVPVGKKYE